MSPSPTIQQTLAATLAKAGIPSREIRCYGSQVLITTMGEDTARRWFRLLQQFCSTVRQPGKGLDEKKNVVGKPEYVKVWRVWGTI